MEDRRVKFINWWVDQMKIYDCDSHIFSMKYIISRLEFNIEQKYWLCWLHANTYQLPTAFVIWNEFPDFENVDFDRLDKWEDENYKRLPYQVDQKWMKGNLSKIFLSYKEIISGSQEKFFNKFNSEDGEDNFDNLWNEIIKKFYKFGRYTAWFYLQNLKEICELNLIPRNLKLRDDGSSSHRAGLCMALGKDEWNVKKRKFSNEEISFLELEAKNILQETVSKYGNKINNQYVDYFSMETALCSYKKIFRERDSRYIGYYLDRFSEDIIKTSSFNWEGINWDLFWDCRNEILLKEYNNKNVCFNRKTENINKYI